MNFEKWQEEMRKIRKPLEGKQNTNRHQSEVFDRTREEDSAK